MPLQRSDCVEITGIDADGRVYGVNITWFINTSKLKRPVKVGDWVEIGGRRNGILISKRVVIEPQF